MTYRRALLLLTLLLALAACGGDQPAPVAEGSGSAMPADEPAALAGSDAVEPPAAPLAPAPAVAPEDESITPAGTDGPAGFHGFGPARFGDDQEAVRISWGRPLAYDRELAPGETCAYLQSDPMPEDGLGIAFMIENGRFARYDVNSSDYQAPGGGRVGSSRAELESLYRSRFTVTPHNYLEEGHDFRVVGPEGSASFLVFELDGRGQVVAWRVGIEPEVDYTEGCS